MANVWFLVHHVKAFERYRDLWVERDPQRFVCSGEVGRVTSRPGGTTFYLANDGIDIALERAGGRRWAGYPRVRRR